MRLQLLLMQLLLCVLPGMEMGASCRLTAWVVEDSSGKVEITCIGDTMDIVSPDGLSLWYKERLTGNYEITYRVQVVVENGSYDRLSDLNCFWGADDPRHPDDFFARSAWRNGEFKNYNTLDLYYVGYGGNDNGTTRFREYHGEYYGVDDAKIKPILKEYTDAAHPFVSPTHWYEVKIPCGEWSHHLCHGVVKSFSSLPVGPMAKGRTAISSLRFVAEPRTFCRFPSSKYR